MTRGDGTGRKCRRRRESREEKSGEDSGREMRRMYVVPGAKSLRLGGRRRLQFRPGADEGREKCVLISLRFDLEFLRRPVGRSVQIAVKRKSASAGLWPMLSGYACRIRRRSPPPPCCRSNPRHRWCRRHASEVTALPCESKPKWPAERHSAHSDTLLPYHSSTLISLWRT